MERAVLEPSGTISSSRKNLRRKKRATRNFWTASTNSRKKSRSYDWGKPLRRPEIHSSDGLSATEARSPRRRARQDPKQSQETRRCVCATATRAKKSPARPPETLRRGQTGLPCAARERTRSQDPSPAPRFPPALLCIARLPGDTFADLIRLLLVLEFHQGEQVYCPSHSCAGEYSWPGSRTTGRWPDSATSTSSVCARWPSRETMATHTASMAIVTEMGASEGFSRPCSAFS